MVSFGGETQCLGHSKFNFDKKISLLLAKFSNTIGQSFSIFGRFEAFKVQKYLDLTQQIKKGFSIYFLLNYIPKDLLWEIAF